MRFRLALWSSLVLSLILSGCVFIDADGVDDVSMYANFSSDGIEVVVQNDNPFPIWIRWASSSYVYQDGYSDRLLVLDPGGTDYTGTPYDESVPAFASSSTWVAPPGAIDPYTGEVWIPWGPPGSQARLVVTVQVEGDVASMDYVYQF